MATVQTSKYFRELFKTLSEEQRLKINSFIRHVQEHGLTNLEGRNKSSDQVPKGTPNRSAKIKYAQEHQLWHYHIGIPEYIDDGKKNGDKTSQYLIHYIKNDRVIKIVDFSFHPPFRLPDSEIIE